MSAATCVLVTLTAFLCLFQKSSCGVLRNKKVLADLTTNKLTREHDGSYGLWSFHGTAMESHANQTEFTYNADLLTNNGSRHKSIASTLDPWMGLTSDQDPLYQEYLLLQAKTAGIDGFLVEWGYENHSSNEALQQLIRIARKHGQFTLGVNWCDHWLTAHLKNKSSQIVVEAFHSNLQYMMDSVFVLGQELAMFHRNHPIIFLFGGGLTSKQFRDVLSKPLRLPDGVSTPIWIGSYLNFASSSALWDDWSGLLNGTYGWAPFVERPTPVSMPEWDYYGTVEDVMQYQKNLTSFGTDCVSNGSCVLWCGSVSPGFDNRGCAGWGRSLRYVPRWDLSTHHSRNTYRAQWEYYINLASSPDLIIIPTMNDFPEATVILPTDSSFEALHSTALLSSRWKNVSQDHSGVSLPVSWFALYSQAIFYKQTPHVDVSNITLTLDKVSSLINVKLYSEASTDMQIIRKNLNKLESQLKVTSMTTDELYPTVKPKIVEGSYFIDKHSGLFLALHEVQAAVLRAANFKGLLRFMYYHQEKAFAHLKVYSSTSRRDKSPVKKELVVSKYPGRPTNNAMYVTRGNYAEVCDIMVTSSGVWESVVVKLLKSNQAWDHSAEHSSDLYFFADSPFLLHNISLEFQILSAHP